MLVRSSVRVAMEMKVRASGMGVHVQMPAPPRVPQNHRAAERDEQQRDEEVGGGPETVREAKPEEYDRAHHDANAGGVADGPRQTESTRVEEPPLAGRERRHHGQVVRLERVTEAQQQAEAGEGEEVRAHGGPQFTLFSLGTLPFLFGYNLLATWPIESRTWSSPLPGWRHCAEIRSRRGGRGMRKRPTRRPPPPATAGRSSACIERTWTGFTAWCVG